jgi:hypothetical protein
MYWDRRSCAYWYPVDYVDFDLCSMRVLCIHAYMYICFWGSHTRLVTASCMLKMQSATRSFPLCIDPSTFLTRLHPQRSISFHRSICSVRDIRLDDTAYNAKQAPCPLVLLIIALIASTSYRSHRRSILQLSNIPNFLKDLSHNDTASPW